MNEKVQAEARVCFCLFCTIQETTRLAFSYNISATRQMFEQSWQSDSSQREHAQTQGGDEPANSAEKHLEGIQWVALAHLSKYGLELPSLPPFFSSIKPYRAKSFYA